MSKKEEIFKKLIASVVDGDEELAGESAGKAIEIGIDPTEAIIKGLAEGMSVVGDYFESQEYFLPEVIISADAFKAGVDVLKPHLNLEKSDKPAKVVIGTVQGDTHDIGKNIVSIMLGASGFEIYDVGRDVSPQVFVDKVKEINADILALSALMTSSMVNMKKVIELLKKDKIRDKVKVIIGGAPISQRYCDQIGADGYSVDAVAAIRKAKNLINQ
ncbi:corrinoid protein [Clostridium sp. JNZ X4-2]